MSDPFGRVVAVMTHDSLTVRSCAVGVVVNVVACHHREIAHWCGTLAAHLGRRQRNKPGVGGPSHTLLGLPYWASLLPFPPEIFSRSYIPLVWGGQLR